LIAWDAAKGEILWSRPERFGVWSGALTTAGDVIFYGTPEGFLKALDTDGRELFKFKTPSSIMGSVFTYELDGKQYVGVLSGVGGWLEALTAPRPDDNVDLCAGLGRSCARVNSPWLNRNATLGGVLTVFSLP
jgi:lanthanide-dependent methanol dehydrogenase